jgi:AcrR family transcriptional regulator
VNNVNIPRRQTYHHGNLREALIRSGLRAIAEDGPERFSLREVASRVGVTASAVYRHFRDKDELLAAIAAECAERLAATITTALADASPHSLARFRHTGIAYVQFAVAHPEHFRAMTMPGVLAKLPAEQRAALEDFRVEQRRALAAGQAAGEIADIDLDELLLAASAATHGLAHMIVEGQCGKVDANRATELAIAVTGALGVGFVPRSTPVGDPMRPSLKRRR